MLREDNRSRIVPGKPNAASSSPSCLSAYAESPRGISRAFPNRLHRRQ